MVYRTLRILKNDDTESNQLQGAILSLTYRQTKKIYREKLQYNGSKTYDELWQTDYYQVLLISSCSDAI